MIYNSTTTLRAIRNADACVDGYAKLCRHLRKTIGHAKLDQNVVLLTVLDSNGLDDALWVLSYAMPDDRLARHFQAWCAVQVLYLFDAEFPNDTRVRDQIAMLRNDNASEAEREATCEAVRAAAWNTTGEATWSAVMASSRKFVWNAALDAANAVWWEASPKDSASSASTNAVWKDARAKQEAQLRKMLKEAA